MSLSHLDAQSNPTMVDVGDKAITRRTATARSIVVLPDAVMAALQGRRYPHQKRPRVSYRDHRRNNGGEEDG